MCFSEIVTLLKDIAIGAAAIAGACVAILGLNTWRVQLKGQTEYELGRRLLISLFKYRDAINGVRNPVMWEYELPNPPKDEAEVMTDEALTHYRTSKAYLARWEKVLSVRSDLYVDLIEAEAFWGEELKERFYKLFDLQHELFSNIRNYLTLTDPKSSAARKAAVGKLLSKKREVMYGALGEDEEDEYRDDFSDAMSNIERYLKPKLSHAGV